MPFLDASFLLTNGTSFIPIIKPRAVYLKLVHLSKCKLYIKVIFFFYLKLSDDSVYNMYHIISHAWQLKKQKLVDKRQFSFFFSCDTILFPLGSPEGRYGPLPSTVLFPNRRHYPLPGVCSGTRGKQLAQCLLRKDGLDIQLRKVIFRTLRLA